jgi:pimeloyl-ACP methyl ester carboxylesterase
VTLVLVHGNPEAAAIWDDLRAALGRDDVVALSPPGFGAPTPPGFGATMAEYADWLVAELEHLARRRGPLDVFGHDWGGGHVAGVAVRRPDLLRSWGFDIAGCVHPDYVWHELAQVWQTPGEGEAAVAGMASAPVDGRAAAYAGMGMTPEAARACAEAFDDEMARCILALYRSARQPAMAELGRRLEAAERRPALVVVPSDDQYTGGPALARETAARIGAVVAPLDGLGHWWMMQDPARGAAAIRQFVDRLG